MSERFDTIVVGAGPAGATAALALAQSGLRVAIFERGEQPGSKNMFGGALYYTEILEKILPDFWKEAPIERYVTKHDLVFMSDDSWTSVSFADKKFGQPPYNAVTLLRAKFDRWLAEKARGAGALLITETLVDDLVRDGGRVVGVKTAREEGLMYADVVIIAEGANSILAGKAGLRGGTSATGFAVAAKEVLALPREVIEARFNLEGDEGVACSFVGAGTQGLPGGAFLYTGKASLSIGVVAMLNSLQERKTSIADLLEHFKNHPGIRPLLKDTVLKEYSGHLIPEGGIRMVPRLYGDGVLVVGDAAGFLCSTGFRLEGMNFAIASGLAAAEAVKKARESRDFSPNGLACYKKFLEQGFVLPTLAAFRHAPGFLANRRIYEVYPSIICRGLGRVFKSDDNPRRKPWSLIRVEMSGKVSLWSLAKDIWRGGRALLW
jgi:electron transfer flavoprotein-quinone oxidoreductase